jgi:hypothetical protein
MKFNNFLKESTKPPKPSTNCDYKVNVFTSFLSPDEKDVSYLYSLSDKTNKNFVLSNDGSVFFWEYTGSKKDKEIFSCAEKSDEKLEKPHASKKEYFAGVLDGKYVVIDSNHKIVISANSFDRMMADIVEDWGKYPIYDWPEPDSKDGSAGVYDRNHYS